MEIVRKIKEWNSVRKLKKILNESEIPKHKPNNLPSTRIFVRKEGFVEGSKNNRKRRTLIDEDGGKFHKLNSLNNNAGMGNFLKQRFTEKLFPFFSISEVLQHPDGEFYSYEKTAKIREISARDFSKKFDVNFCEAEVEVEILKILIGQIDRTVASSHNIKFYEDGTYTIFDLAYNSLFVNKQDYFLYEYKYDYDGYLLHLPTKIKQIALSKVKKLINFYLSADGVDYFKENCNNLNGVFEFEPKEKYNEFLERLYFLEKLLVEDLAQSN